METLIEIKIYQVVSEREISEIVEHLKEREKVNSRSALSVSVRVNACLVVQGGNRVRGTASRVISSVSTRARQEEDKSSRGACQHLVSRGKHLEPSRVVRARGLARQAHLECVVNVNRVFDFASGFSRKPFGEFFNNFRFKHLLIKRFVQFIMTTREALAIGSDTKPPVLFRGDYNMWRDRFLDFIDRQDLGEYIRLSLRKNQHNLILILQLLLIR
ncbi:hypothetical protein OSB04_028895 [Centaurea solstitialis]|uniref:Uncharacterized protein n=1 Tax=Centaurea solstitialis TaxID=347529 RepID=A0AA38W9R2_9ASTR|nr:hypothetical protein OSB04_028895 [Centaurea solstitialis]